jgi:hypothetical protein
VAFLACVLLLRLVLDQVLTRVVNWQLSRAAGVQGGVGWVHFSFWPGRFEVSDVSIDLCAPAGTPHAGQPRPLLRVRRVATHWRYAPLLQGAVAGDLEVDAPQVTIFKEALAHKKGTKPQPKATADNKPFDPMRWREPFDHLMPLRVDGIRLRDGQVRFVDEGRQPPVDVALTDIALTVRNVANRKQLKDRLYATADLRATLPGQGGFRLDLRMDPLADSPTFAMEFALERVGLVPLNELLRAYGGFDVRRGRLEVFSEVAARGGQFEGYIKPLLQEVEVRVLQEKGHNNPAAVAWRATVGAATRLLRNTEVNRLGTKLPFEGRFDTPHLGIWAAVVETLRNAFVQALLPQLEHSAAIGDLPK